MKNIGSIVANGFPDDPRRSQQPKEAAMNATADLVNDLFIELQAAFPAWRYSMPDAESLDAAKVNWTQTFFENDINQHSQLSWGMKKARKSPSPHFPSSGEFIDWCTPDPEDYGLPGERAAFNEACKNSHDPGGSKWSHPAVFVAGRETVFWDLASKPESETFVLFKHNYSVVIRRVMAGQDFSEALAKALPPPPPPKRKPASDATEKSFLKDIMSNF